MKKMLLILLSVLILAGCTKNNNIQSEDDTSVFGSTETFAENPKDKDAKTQKEEILSLWKRDITLQDDWVPTQDLSSFPERELSVAASESVPVIISANSREIKSDLIESAKGAVYSEYTVVDMNETDRKEYSKIRKELSDYNEYAEQNAILEVSDGENRFNSYVRDHALSFLTLTSRTGIEVFRADSGIFSYFRSVFRSNQGFEPDYYEVYGKTIDVSTGKVLTLNDIFTDTDALAQMIWEALLRNGSRTETDPDKTEFLDILQTAIRGCRDDGSIGWVLDPMGIEFDLIESVEEEGETRHIRERAYIPFTLCEGILRQNIAGVGYDYMVRLEKEDTEAVLGKEIPDADDSAFYEDFFLAQKGGTLFLYCAAEGHTDIYSTADNSFEKIGEVPAEIGYNQNDHMIGYQEWLEK